MTKKRGTIWDGIRDAHNIHEAFELLKPLEFDMMSLNVPILRSSCHSTTSRPSKSCWRA